jgi:very-short-patch-repair endonuclease
MSDSKNSSTADAPPNTIEFIDGELFVFGKQIRAHQEMPWLFCATDLHKACEFFIRRAAVNKGKDSDSAFKSKRPVSWIHRNLNDEESISCIAEITRQRIRERGAYLGLKQSSKKSINLLDTITDKEMILYSRKGNSPTSGTYLSLHALRDYATFFSIPELSEAFHKLVPSSSESISSKVKKLSSTRKELEFSKYLTGLASYHKAHLETQRPELNKYKVDFCFKSKSHGVWFIEFDEDHHEAQVAEDLLRWKEIQEKYKKRKDLPKRGLFFTRVKEGDEYAFLAKFSCYLITGNLSDLSFIHIASK